MIGRALAALVFVLAMQLCAQGPMLRLSEYRSHFAANAGSSPESGSRDGWESFPIAQETGYDPTITPETRGGESFLVREAAPTREGGFQLGFIRRIDFVTGASANLTLRVRAPFSIGSTQVTVSIFHGKEEERHTAALEGASWQQIHFSLSASTTPVSALALAASFPEAHAGRIERFELADVHLHALAVPRVDLLAPAALWDPSRRLYYMRRALHPGDMLEVIAKGTVHWRLTDPLGGLCAETRGPVVYRFGTGAAPGIWTLSLSSPTGRSTALLLVRPERPRGLLFDQAPAIAPALLASVRERRDVLRKTAFVTGGNNIGEMSRRFLLPGLPSYFNVLLQPTELAMLDAIDFRASGDAAALAEARSLLGAIAAWPLWVHPWFPAHGYHSYYPVGIAAKYVVVAQQFLGSELPTNTRQALERSLFTHVVEPIYEEYVREDRLQFNTSNWIGNTVGGALLAALGSEDSDVAGYALGLYVKERDHVSAGYTADGSYGEGVTYQRFDLGMTTLVAEAAKRLLGQSIDARLMGGERYMQHAAYGKDGLLDFGDSHVDLVPSNVFAYQAAQNVSDNMTHFYLQYRDSGTAELLSRVLWEPGIQVPGPGFGPKESASRLFAERGIAVLRDDWSSGSTVIAMRAGMNFNHNHADQGSLFFAMAGKLWLGEAGYADYYKDPLYGTYNIQAAGHNTLLLDHNPESQQLPGNAVFGRAPSMEHGFVGEGASLVEADLGSVYPGTLQTCTRTLFYPPGGPLYVVDRVESQAARFVTQLWHPQQRIEALNASRNFFTLVEGTEQVQVRAFSSAPIETVVRDVPLPLTAYEQAERGVLERPLQVEFSNASPQQTTAIVTLIGRAGEVASATTRRERDSYTVGFRASGVRIEQDGDRAIVGWWPGGVMLLHGRRLAGAAGSTVLANHAVDLKMTPAAGDRFTLEVRASVPTTLSLSGLAAMVGTGGEHEIQGEGKVLVAAGRSVVMVRPE